MEQNIKLDILQFVPCQRLQREHEAGKMGGSDQVEHDPRMHTS